MSRLFRIAEDKGDERARFDEMLTFVMGGAAGPVPTLMEVPEMVLVVASITDAMWLSNSRQSHFYRRDGPRVQTDFADWCTSLNFPRAGMQQGQVSFSRYSGGLRVRVVRAFRFLAEARTADHTQD
jgi:hypothetical protein